jgi:hypothetical protein
VTVVVVDAATTVPSRSTACALDEADARTLLHHIRCARPSLSLANHKIIPEIKKKRKKHVDWHLDWL